MASVMIDRAAGLSSSSAWKGPCRVATTANITLAGLQTIDGIVLVADDRVLVKNQTVPSQNGIYIADTGTWARARDFSRTRDVRTGTRVLVTSGTVNNDIDYRLTTADPVVIGTDNITFEAETLISSFGGTLIDDADAVSARATLGVVIGTDVQAYNAALASIAGLTTSADKLPYTTASNTYAVAALTSFGRSLIDDADAATARATLGSVIGTNVQAYSALLADIAALTITEAGIIYGVGADNVSLLAKGTANQVLAMNAGATAPEWVTNTANSSMVFIESQTVSVAVATIVFDDIAASGYSKFVLVARDVVTAEAAGTSVVRLQVSTDNGATYKNSSGDYYSGTTAAIALQEFNVPGNTSTLKKSQAEVHMFGLGNSNHCTVGYLMANARGVSATQVVMSTPQSGNTRITAEADNAFKLTVVGGSNFSAGTFILYGVRDD